MNKILIATHNKGKLEETMNGLKDLNLEIISLNDLNISEDVEETGETYEENAILKAEFFGKLTGLPTIADDSGIIVEALEGELGVKTRRWGAGEKANDQEWLDYFLERMSKEENKNTEFISVIAFYRPGKETKTFRGECKGVILSKAPCKLEDGVPLSSIFLPDSKTKVFSMMSKDEKYIISHRGMAIKKFKEHLKAINNG